MKWIAVILLVILMTLQYRIWFGDSSYQKIKIQEEQIQKVQLENDELTARNQKLFAEIKNLRNGSDAVEERARNQLEMVKDGEVFFRILTSNNAPHQASLSNSTPSKPLKPQATQSTQASEDNDQ